MTILKTKLVDEGFDDEEFIKAIAISPETLIDSMMKQPSVYWKFGKINAHAQKVLSDAEDRLKYLEQQAKLCLANEEKNLSEGDKKLTDKVRLATAMTSKDYAMACVDVETARKQVAEARHEATLMEFAERCMRSRGDLLKALAYIEAGGNHAESNSELRAELTTRKNVMELEDQVREKFNRD